MIPMNADWEKKNIVLVDPAIWPRYTGRAGDLRPVYRGLREALRKLKVPVTLLGRRDAPLDIWIRDWGSVEGVFFRYAPKYAQGAYSPAAIRQARMGLVRRLRAQCRTVPLVLDGGNVVHNGRVALVTKNVLRENSHFTPLEVERAIAAVDFERVVFIPNEPGDEIGHSDGMCRFVSERVLLVNDYDGAGMGSFGRRLRRVLRAAKLEAEIVALPWFFRGARKDGVPSTVGCYMNFIQLAQGIILPAFAHRNDEQAHAVIAGLRVGPVRSVLATPLAEFGGVFNCVSLTY